MARSKKQIRRHAAKHPWPDPEVDESPFAQVTADIVTRGQFNLGSSQTDEELQRSRFLASTAGLLVFKGEAAPSPMDVPAEGSALAEAIAAHVLADAEVQRLRDELAALKAQNRTTTADTSEQAVADIRAQADAARDEADAEIRSLRDELAALKATLHDREAALAEAAQANQTGADSRAQSAQALADAREQAEAARAEADAQIQTLRDELSALRSTLTEHEAALARTAADHEQAHATWESDSRDSLSRTAQEWKDAEAARLADAESKWREQSEQSLAELRAQADAARDQAEREMARLREDAAALRAALTDRDAALARAASEHEQAQARWQQESHATVSSAEQTWKAAEATRLAETETKWKVHLDQALAAVKTEADKAREAAEGTARGLQDQIASLQTTLAERETALAGVAQEMERAREQAREDLDAALAKTKALQAEEAQRLAAAEAKWKQQSAAALAELQSRAQAAEGALVQLRLEANRARSDATGGSINAPKSGGDRSVFGTKAVAREPEPTAIRLPTREARGQARQEQIVLQPHRVLEDTQAPKKRGMGRDLLVVAVLAVLAYVAYPRIVPLIPEPYRSNIAALTGGLGVAQNVATQGSAVIVRDVNLRGGPSTTANIIATLAQGQRVAMLSQRDEWTFVEVAADTRNPQSRRGWVYSSYLKDTAANADEDAADAVDADGTE